MVSRRLRKKRVLQKLVYIKTNDCVEEAVEREVELKRAPRNQINKLVESVNPVFSNPEMSLKGGCIKP
jgi:predicted GIY-YIG superfamily endonuclease